MSGLALVVIRKGDDVAAALRQAAATHPLQGPVEAVEVDPQNEVEPDPAGWTEAGFLCLSEGVRSDNELQRFVLSIVDRFVRLDLPGPWPWYLVKSDLHEPTKWPWLFTCNICGTENRWNAAPPGREAPSCNGCHSNVRYRATVQAVVESVLGTNEPLPAIKPQWGIRGLGISDWLPYALRLAALFTYTNTFLDSEPRLDLTDNPREDQIGVFNFAIAGDVFEHVAPPVEEAMVHLRTMLRPGGVAILTVPFTTWPNHIEHFPGLYRWSVEETTGESVLVNERADGTIERFTSLCFHGPGRSLEMRVFTKDSFVTALLSAGFVDVHFSEHPCARHGILLGGWPGPVVARAP